MRVWLVGASLAVGVSAITPPAVGQTVAYGVCPPGTPQEQAQNGWQQQARGRWVEAEACLRAAVASADDPWVRGHRAQLDPSLRRVGENVGGLQVLGGVSGARVRVDGIEVATLPMERPVRVQATTVLVEVLAEGYHSTERRVDVPAGEHARVETISLVPVVTEPVTPEPPTPVPSPATPAPLAHPVSPAPAALLPATNPSTVQARDGTPLRTAGWIGAIVGGASVVGGIVAFAVREAQISLAVSHSCNDELPQDGPGDCSSLHASTALLEPLGIVLLVVGGALGAGGTAAILGTQGGSHGPTTMGLHAGWNGSGSAGVWWDGRF